MQSLGIHKPVHLLVPVADIYWSGLYLWTSESVPHSPPLHPLWSKIVQLNGQLYNTLCQPFSMVPGAGSGSERIWYGRSRTNTSWNDLNGVCTSGVTTWDCIFSKWLWTLQEMYTTVNIQCTLKYTEWIFKISIDYQEIKWYRYGEQKMNKTIYLPSHACTKLERLFPIISISDVSLIHSGCSAQPSKVNKLSSTNIGTVCPLFISLKCYKKCFMQAWIAFTFK